MERSRICALFKSIVREVDVLPRLDTILCDQHGPFRRAVEHALQDATSYLARDPALHGSWDAVLSPGSSFRATAAYRLAHMLWCLDGPEEISHSDSRSIALALAFAARRETGVEIHPGASLGANFVVDHGYGTVIGETVETGTDCYILNAVTLGSRGISGNRAGRRHPALGDRVEIGAFACVFGAVTIGDDVFIGPHCMISSDISPGMFVTVKQPISMRPHSANAPNRAFASPN